MSMKIKSKLVFRASGGPESRGSWVKASIPGKTTYRGKEIELSEEYWKAVARELRRSHAVFDEIAKEKGAPSSFRQPVRIEHEARGSRHGRITDAKITKGELWLFVEWSEAAWEKIQDGEYEYISVGIDPSFTAETGEIFSPYLREVSIVDSPHFKSIGRIQDYLGVTLSDASKEKIQSLSQEEIDLMEELLQVMREMHAMLSALMPKEDGESDGESDGEMPEDDEEMEAAEDKEDQEMSDREGAQEPQDGSGVVMVNGAPVDVEALMVEMSELRRETKKLSKRLRMSGEMGKPGDAPVALSDLSYEEKIKHFMDKEGISRLDAVEKVIALEDN